MSEEEDVMRERDIAVREIYIALEIIQRRCQEFEELKEFPGKDIERLMNVFSRKYLDKPA